MNKIIGLRSSFHLKYKFFLRMASTSNSYLINDSKYSFLHQLGLSEVNDGVFSGKWYGDGKVCFCFLVFHVNNSSETCPIFQIIDSVCPANNKIIARVKEVY